MIDCSKTANYLSERLRMTKRSKGKGCDIKCSECPLSYTNNGASEFMSCITFEMHYPLQAISIVQRWSNEHPRKTYLSEFLKNYPNAWLNEKGIPKRMCPSMLGLKDLEDCGKRNCVECWNQPMPAEGGEE
jgi:hypothetical protein